LRSDAIRKGPVASYLQAIDRYAAKSAHSPSVTPAICAIFISGSTWNVARMTIYAKAGLGRTAKVALEGAHTSNSTKNVVQLTIAAKPGRSGPAMLGL
jgi:hypothetical protein